MKQQQLLHERNRWRNATICAVVLLFIISVSLSALISMKNQEIAGLKLNFPYYSEWNHPEDSFGINEDSYSEMLDYKNSMYFFYGSKDLDYYSNTFWSQSADKMIEVTVSTRNNFCELRVVNVSCMNPPYTNSDDCGKTFRIENGSSDSISSDGSGSGGLK
jgi:hypothetical protein